MSIGRVPEETILAVHYSWIALGGCCSTIYTQRKYVGDRSHIVMQGCVLEFESTDERCLYALKALLHARTTDALDEEMDMIYHGRDHGKIRHSSCFGKRCSADPLIHCSTLNSLHSYHQHSTDCTLTLDHRMLSP